MVKGLSESTRGVWSGDVDMNDGTLEKLFQNFSRQLKFVKSIGLGDRATGELMLSDLEQVLQDMKNYMEFLIKGIIIMYIHIMHT